MSTDQQITRIVRSWLDEGVTTLPDRVLDAVLDRVPATPQRRPWWQAWRSPYMNNPVRYLVAAAAVLVVALVGYQFLPSNTGSGSTPTASPSSTLAPTLEPTPTLTAIPRLPSTDSLEPGRYRPYRDLDLTVEAPAGWGTCCEAPASIIWNNSSNADGFAALFFEDFTQVTVYGDACKWRSGATSQPEGAEAITQAFADREGNEARGVTVAGLPAFHVKLVVPGDLPVEEQSDGDATFLDCDDGEYRHWSLGPDGARYAQHLEQIEDLYIVDIAGKTIAFSLSHFPQTDEADFQALEAMLASVEID